MHPTPSPNIPTSVHLYGKQIIVKVYVDVMERQFIQAHVCAWMHVCLLSRIPPILIILSVLFSQQLYIFIQGLN